MAKREKRLRHREIPGVSAFGVTRAAALQEFETVLETAVEAERAEGWPQPPPQWPVDPSLPSGAFRVRLPRYVHALLARRAEAEGVSQNTLVVALLAQGLAADLPFGDPTQADPDVGQGRSGSRGCAAAPSPAAEPAGDRHRVPRMDGDRSTASRDIGDVGKHPARGAPAAWRPADRRDSTARRAREGDRCRARSGVRRDEPRGCRGTARSPARGDRERARGRQHPDRRGTDAAAANHGEDPGRSRGPVPRTQCMHATAVHAWVGFGSRGSLGWEEGVRLDGYGCCVIHHRGSHRQLEHPTKPGRVTVAGHHGDTLPPGTLNSITKQAALRKRGRPVRGYVVVIERAEDDYAACVPDLHGCVATGATRREVEDRIRSGIALHVAGLRADGLEVPEPTSRVAVVERATATGF